MIRATCRHAKNHTTLTPLHIGSMIFIHICLPVSEKIMKFVAHNKRHTSTFPNKMKRALSLFLSLISICSVCAQQMRRNSSYQIYIEQYKDLAIEQMLRYNIPASITLAQGLFESRAGQSDLALRSNNHFGIKCHGWQGRKVYHDDDAAGECFRAYDNVRQSFEDHSRFLANNTRYKRLFSLSRTDYKGWAHGLKACGYATNPQYAYGLINIIELYNLQLYDRSTGYDKFLADHASKDRPQRGQRLHPIKMYNDNYYLIARAGDTFKSIGKEVGISYRKLARYNERVSDDTVEEGDIIYLKKKRKRASKAFKNRPHIVKNGESMYYISQLYGMRLKYVYKKNHLPDDYQIKVGDTIRVY